MISLDPEKLSAVVQSADSVDRLAQDINREQIGLRDVQEPLTMDPTQLFKRYQDLRRYVGWSETDAERLEKVGRLLEPFFNLVIDDFYDEISRHEAATAVITGGDEQIALLKRTLRAWLNDLFNGPYDVAFVTKRFRVGWRHVEIGLDQTFTNVAMARVRFQLQRQLASNWTGSIEERDEAAESLNRILDLDLAIIEAAYQAEFAAKEQLRLLGAAVADLEVGLLICSEGATWFESKVVFANEALARITGYSVAEFQNCTPQLLEGTTTNRQVIESLDQHLASNEPMACELAVQRKDGRNLLVELHLSPVRSATGRRTHSVATLRDITEQKAAEQRALQAERLAAIGKAMTGLAHESRNALQRSQAALDMLGATVGSEDADAQKLIQRIQVAQDDLHRLYEDVREYARPIVVNPKSQQVDELLRQAWDELIVKREGRQTKLVEIRRTENVSCEVEPFLIRQAFRNILDNSLAACPDSVEITVTWQESELEGQKALSVTLKDNGPGVTAESQDQLLEEFFTTKTHGTGLGLAIVNRFAMAHHGRLEIEPRPGEGLSVRILLPYACVN